MAFAESAADFLDTTTGFAVAVVYNGGVTINIIFDAAYIEVDAGGVVGFQSNTPRALVAAADTPSIAIGDTLVIAGVTFAVVEIQPDGTGVFTELRLERQ